MNQGNTSLYILIYIYFSRILSIPLSSFFSYLQPLLPTLPNLSCLSLSLKTIKKFEQKIKRKKRKKSVLNYKSQSLFCRYQTSREARVFIGFSFNPMLSGERSSGEMQDGLRGLLGLSLNWHGLYNPYPIRKYSIGISIACGCSSVTIDPQACTCNIKTKSLNLNPSFCMLIDPLVHICLHISIIYCRISKTKEDNHKDCIIYWGEGNY